MSILGIVWMVVWVFVVLLAIKVVRDGLEDSFADWVVSLAFWTTILTIGYWVIRWWDFLTKPLW